MKEGIDTIYKITRTKILKITFKESAAAKKATEHGILGFHMNILSHSIKIEQYIPLMTFLRCYAIEDHIISKCPKPKEFKICSECSSDDHTWRDCNTGNTKLCINCNGDHRTLANKCPLRKKALEEKRQQLKNNNAKTYSSITSGTTTTAHLNLPTTTPTIEKDMAAKMMALILPDNPPLKQILNLTKDNQTITSQQSTENTETTKNTNSQMLPSTAQQMTTQENISQDEMNIPPLEKNPGKRYRTPSNYT
ncbi:hypothetical protein E2C01_056294 [Portunus trituberculatus]|uniref:Nucleic-acid-binding protein from transposon X-element n=1 Tax=Portunus trituberculatus TaxID=210409 RepID=A0A5B7GPZ0_PORTR|nr:hypothetical protein [Portunus trituberculatus]